MRQGKLGIRIFDFVTKLQPCRTKQVEHIGGTATNIMMSVLYVLTLFRMASRHDRACIPLLLLHAHDITGWIVYKHISKLSRSRIYYHSIFSSISTVSRLWCTGQKVHMRK